MDLVGLWTWLVDLTCMGKHFWVSLDWSRRGVLCLVLGLYTAQVLLKLLRTVHPLAAGTLSSLEHGGVSVLAPSLELFLAFIMHPGASLIHRIKAVVSQQSVDKTQRQNASLVVLLPDSYCTGVQLTLDARSVRAGPRRGPDVASF